jgi:hypothetical protein
MENIMTDYTEPPTDFSKPCFEVFVEITQSDVYLVRADNEAQAERIAESRFWGEYGSRKIINGAFEMEFDTDLIAEAGEDLDGNPIT